MAYKTGNKPWYTTPSQMSIKIDEYFDQCKTNTEHRQWINKRGELQEGDISEIPTIEGLFLYLGFSTYQSLQDYCNKEDEEQKRRDPSFTSIILRAKNRCKTTLNQLALSGQVDARIAALNLSANHGMTERRELDTTIHGDPDKPLQWRIDVIEPGRPVKQIEMSDPSPGMLDVVSDSEDEVD